jgi:hypothetical protein
MRHHHRHDHNWRYAEHRHDGLAAIGAFIVIVLLLLFFASIV